MRVEGLAGVGRRRPGRVLTRPYVRRSGGKGIVGNQITKPMIPLIPLISLIPLVARNQRQPPDIAAVERIGSIIRLLIESASRVPVGLRSKRSKGIKGIKGIIDR